MRETPSDLKSPASKSVDWMATSKGKTITVTEKLWFDARRRAMAILSCGPDELVVTQVPDPPVAPDPPVPRPSRKSNNKPHNGGKKSRK